MKKITTVKLDVTKIDKSKLFKGEKGTYLDAVIFWNDEPDQFGQDGVLIQSVTKEEREAGIKGAILGNVKNIQTQQRSTESAPPDDNGDSLPF